MKNEPCDICGTVDGHTREGQINGDEILCEKCYENEHAPERCPVCQSHFDAILNGQGECGNCKE
jgi:hypothetical protein